MANDTQIRAIVRDIGRVTEHVVRKVTLDVTANLVATTPVDTGWARANWVPAIGAPAETGLEDITPTPDDAARARGQQQRALAGVATGYKTSQGRVFVSNNVPYIGELNDGKSTQAPAGFVQQAIYKAVTEDLGR